VVQVVEGLLCNCEALSSNSNPIPPNLLPSKKKTLEEGGWKILPHRDSLAKRCWGMAFQFQKGVPSHAPMDKDRMNSSAFSLDSAAVPGECPMCISTLWGRRTMVSSLQTPLQHRY
jgi:hypothetical protein